MRRWFPLPWPQRKDRKASIACAILEYDQTMLEGIEVKRTAERLRAMREANHFRQRFEAALRGTT